MLLAGVVCCLFSLKQAAAECLANVIHHLKSPAAASSRALASRRRRWLFQGVSVINGSLQSRLVGQKSHLRLLRCENVTAGGEKGISPLLGLQVGLGLHFFAALIFTAKLDAAREAEMRRRRGRGRC